MTGISSNPSQEFWEPHYAKMSRPSGGRVSAALRQFVEARPIGTALELGCARGDDAIWLAKQGWTVMAVDVAEAALIAARASALEAGVSNRITFERHDLSATFPNGKFELVTAMFFHSPVDFGRVQALRSATESVARGGLLLVVAHGSRAPWSWGDPDTVYPTAQDELKDLALNPDEWRQVFVGPIKRDATGPDDQRATVIDTVVAIERLSPQTN
ncbi:MAG: SAM-dependent methyltransferase [Alphaproteobacteria bacterium]